MNQTYVSNLIIGSPIWIKYKVINNLNECKLKWYKGRIVLLSITDNNETSLRVKFDETEQFASVCEDYKVKSSAELTQGEKHFPYSTCEQDGSTDRELVRGKEEAKNSQVITMNMSREAPTVDFVTLERRLRVVEAVLRVRRNQVFFNVCGILNTSLQLFKKRVRRPSKGESDMTECHWNVKMDCSYEDFKGLACHAKESLQELATVSPHRNDRVVSDNEITVSSFKVFCNYFGISEENYNQLLCVKRVDRNKKLTALKVVGTFVEPSNPSSPTLFCLGGDFSKWNEDLKFFTRQHGHKTPNGIRTAPFNSVTSSDGHSNILSKLEDVKPCKYRITWTRYDSGSLCSIAEPHSMVMGKLLVTIPFTIFNDMTAASRVHAAMKENIHESESDGFDSL